MCIASLANEIFHPVCANSRDDKCTTNSEWVTMLSSEKHQGRLRLAFRRKVSCGRSHSELLERKRIEKPLKRNLQIDKKCRKNAFFELFVEVTLRLPGKSRLHNYPLRLAFPICGTICKFRVVLTNEFVRGRSKIKKKKRSNENVNDFWASH